MTFDCVQCLFENKDECGQVEHIGSICEPCIQSWDTEENERLTALSKDPVIGPIIEREYELVSPAKRQSN